MSAANNIPFDIQVEIIKKVFPVKSLIRFRSVSKQWKALIDSSQFIMDHCVNPAQPHHLLVSYKAGDNEDHKFVSIVDDDSFPHHKFSPTVPPTVKLLRRVTLVGCSHGLVCLSGFTPFRRRNRKELIVVWNPAIRKSVDIHLPNELFVFGFGVCPKTSDIKIVKITLRRQETDPRSSVSQKAEVFTLRSGAWRTIYMNLPCELTNVLLNPVAIDGVIHWVASERVPKNHLSREGILKFDLTSEEFGLLELPFSPDGSTNHLSKLNESLVVSNCVEDWGVWMMSRKGVSKPSFTKVFPFKVNSPSTYYIIVGFRKNGQPMMNQLCKPYSTRVTQLKVFEPSSKQMNGVGIYGLVTKRASSYTESLFLLNHSDSIIQ